MGICCGCDRNISKEAYIQFDLDGKQRSRADSRSRGLSAAYQSTQIISKDDLVEVNFEEVLQTQQGKECVNEFNDYNTADSFSDILSTEVTSVGDGLFKKK